MPSSPPSHHGPSSPEGEPSADPAPHGRCPRLLGVDFGERRIGLAVGDPETGLAFPLTTIPRSSDRQALAAIAEHVAEEEVGGLVVGHPRNVDGTLGPAAGRAARFARRLGAATGLSVRLVDETLTSVAARERLREAGVDPRRHPDRIDAVAAQILLEEAFARTDATVESGDDLSSSEDPSR